MEKRLKSGVDKEISQRGGGIRGKRRGRGGTGSEGSFQRVRVFLESRGEGKPNFY